MIAEIILGIGLLVFLAHFFTAAFHRTRIPDVLPLMLLGILLGPVLHLVQPGDFGRVGSVMSQLALIVILFESGIALDPKVLVRIITPILRLTLVTFGVTVAAGFAVAYYGLGMSAMLSASTGVVLGGTSAAVVIALVKTMKMPDPMGTVLVLESALGDVLCIVILLGLLEGAAVGRVEPLKMVGHIVASLSMAAAIGLAGGLGWLLVLDRVRQFPNTAFTTLAVVFILFGVADAMGFSGAIAALAFGATLTNYQALPLQGLRMFRERQLGTLGSADVSFFLEFLFLLKIFFFVYLGVSIQLQDLHLILWAGAFCAAIYLARLVIVRLTVFGENASWFELAITSLMVPKGLVSAVLAGMIVERGVEGGETVRNFTYMVVLISITLSAVMIPLAERGPVRTIFQKIFANKGRIDDGTAPIAAATHH